MTIATRINSMGTHLANAYRAVETLGGGVLPEHKNLANLAAAVDSIPTVWTLTRIKEALNSGGKLPDIGTEIADTVNGVSAPFIVGQIEDVLRADGATSKAVGLVRKDIAIRSFANGQSGLMSWDYTTCPINTYLNNAYWNACSEEARKCISSVKIRRTGTTPNLEVRFFILSVEQVYGVADGGTVAINDTPWEIWKERTGLSAPSNGVNNGRRLDDDGWWLRNTNNGVYGSTRNAYQAFVREAGQITADSFYYKYAILPACYVAAD